MTRYSVTDRSSLTVAGNSAAFLMMQVMLMVEPTDTYMLGAPRMLVLGSVITSLSSDHHHHSHDLTPDTEPDVMCDDRSSGHLTLVLPTVL